MNTQIAGGGASTKRRIIRWALSALVLLLAFATANMATQSKDTPSAPGHDHGPAGASELAPPVRLTDAEAHRIGVTYAVAERTALDREIRTVGQVTFDETKVKTFSLRVEGWVEELHANFSGQSISEGAPLLALHSPMLVTAQDELFLAKQLVADVADGSSDTRANAQSLLASARSRLEYWGVSPETIEAIESSEKVQRTITFTSPFRGFVVAKNVSLGQRVMAGEDLYRIVDLRTVWVEGEVFERDLSAVRLGQIVEAELDALPGRRLSGRITYVYPTLNAETRTSRVRVEFGNAEMLLKPGMYATLLWNAATGVAAVAVPRTAVVATGRRNLVFVKLPDGMLEPRLVDIGSTSATHVEILRGVEAGETVVASATFLVDAESNLSTLLGGMGNMPGMDMTAPKSPDAGKSGGMGTMPGMDMPGAKMPNSGGTGDGKKMSGGKEGHDAHSGH